MKTQYVPKEFTSNLGSLRVINKNDEPWFVLSDITKMIKGTNTTIARKYLHGDLYDQVQIKDMKGPPAVVVSETGVLVILCKVRGNKKTIKSLWDWVENEILPGFRAISWDTDEEDDEEVRGKVVSEFADSSSSSDGASSGAGPKTETELEPEPLIFTQGISSSRSESEPEPLNGNQSQDQFEDDEEPDPETKEIQVFSNGEFGNIRVIVKDGKPFFLANDAAKKLGYKKPENAIARHCNNSIITCTPVSGAQGVTQTRRVRFIPESDLNRLVMRSDLPEAIRFQDWVCRDVLPQIRKHGAYLTEDALVETLSEPDFWVKLVKNLAGEYIAKSGGLGAIIESIVGQTTAFMNPNQAGTKEADEFMKIKIEGLQKEIDKEREFSSQMKLLCEQQRQAWNNSGEGAVMKKDYWPDFNPDKHYLGRPCKQRHDYKGSGKTLRYKANRRCIVCGRQSARQHQQMNYEYKKAHKNPERIRQCHRKSKNKKTASLADSYVKEKLRRMWGLASVQDVPEEFIQVKREQIMLHRKIKEFKKALQAKEE